MVLPENKEEEILDGRVAQTALEILPLSYLILQASLVGTRRNLPYNKEYTF